MSELVADSLRDLRLNSDREIEVGADGDFRLTSGIETVEQSAGINASGVLLPLIGEPIVPGTLADVESELEEVLSNDVQLDDVKRVNITEVDRTNETVTAEVFVGLNNSFTLNINA